MIVLGAILIFLLILDYFRYTNNVQIWYQQLSYDDFNT